MSVQSLRCQRCRCILMQLSAEDQPSIYSTLPWATLPQCSNNFHFDPVDADLSNRGRCLTFWTQRAFLFSKPKYTFPFLSWIPIWRVAVFWRLNPASNALLDNLSFSHVFVQSNLQIQINKEQVRVRTSCSKTPGRVECRLLGLEPRTLWPLESSRHFFCLLDYPAPIPSQGSFLVGEVKGHLLPGGLWLAQEVQGALGGLVDWVHLFLVLPEDEEEEDEDEDEDEEETVLGFVVLYPVIVTVWVWRHYSFKRFCVHTVVSDFSELYVRTMCFKAQGREWSTFCAQSLPFVRRLLCVQRLPADDTQKHHSISWIFPL